MVISRELHDLYYLCQFKVYLLAMGGHNLQSLKMKHYFFLYIYLITWR